MGTVYVANDLLTNKPVALKMLSEESVDRDRFMREAQLLAQLDHPSIVRYIAHGEAEDGAVFLAMEWLEGRDLSARLADGPLGFGPSIELGIRVADALAAAHRAGIVHRDVKPSNLFLRGGNVEDVVLIDFGIARGLGGTAMTRTGTLVGTPGYMAPEQARGESNVDARADVFSLGCVLFEAISGRPPFYGETTIAVLAKVLLDDRPRLSDVVSDTPDPIDELVARMLASNRAERPQSVAEVLARLEDLRGHMGSLGTQVTRLTLTRSERRLRCVMLVAPALGLQASGGDSDPTALISYAATAVADPGGNASTLSRVKDLVKSLRGRAEALPGGALVVTLDGTGSLADQALRAARCALAVRDLAPGSVVALGTGRGLDTSASASHAVDRAAARIASVPLGVVEDGVLLDDVTAGLLASAFDIVKGRGGAVLRGAVPEQTSGGLLGRALSCVGREKELAMLGIMLDECFEESVARVALVLGQAGSGKSRLRHELAQRLAGRDDVAVWVGRGDPMSAGSPNRLLSRAIAAGLGLSDAAPEERRALLHTQVSALVPESEATRIASFLGEVVGVPAAPSPELLAARQDPLLMGDQVRRAVIDFFDAFCKKRPLVLVLEDLQWGDWPSIKLVDAALGGLTKRPLFVLGTARPEVEETFPRLFAERTPQVLRLGPLTARAVERLVREALGDRCDDDLVARVVANASGLPLHVEEILRVILDGQEGALPETLLAMIDARLEALDPAARRVLRAASLYGFSFWQASILPMLGAENAPDLPRWLDELVARQWLQRAATSRFVGEIEYNFRQDLSREAAYARLTESDKRVGHGLAGEWLHEHGEPDAEVLARHFELAENGARAAEHLVRAAERALDANDFAAVVDRATRAARLAAATVWHGRARALEAEAHQHLGDFQAARTAGLDALEGLPEGSASACRAAAVVGTAALRLGDLDTLRAMGRRFVGSALSYVDAAAYVSSAATTATQLAVGGDLPMADQLLEAIARLPAKAFQDPSARGQLARARGARAAFGGDVVESQIELRRGVLAFDEAGDLRAACALRKTLGWYAAESGALEEGEAALRAAIQQAELLGLPNLIAHARHDLVSPLARLGALEEAEREERHALSVFVAQGDRRFESGAHAMLSFIARLAGDAARAEEEAQLALQTASSGPARLTALAHLATALLAAGRVEEARTAADEGLALLAEHGASEEGVTLLRLTSAKADWALGNRDRARSTFDAARRDVLQRAARLGELGAAFVARIEENAEVLSLSKAWLGDAGAPAQ